MGFVRGEKEGLGVGQIQRGGDGRGLGGILSRAT